MRKNLWAAAGVTAVAVGALAACGGGDSGGSSAPFPIVPPAGGSPSLPPAPPPPPPPPPPAPPPAPSDSAAACVNEADFNAGTVVDYDLRNTAADGANTTGRLTTTTGQREAFAGANPVTFQPVVYDQGGNPSGVGTIFKDLTGGNTVRYGQRSGAGNTLVTTTSNPPVTIPVAMQPGQKVTLVRRETSVSVGGSTSVDISEDLTYIGRETLQTPVGTYSTCKFTSVISSKPDEGAAIVVTASTWIAAEGPYRGQFLKSFVPAGTSQPETTSEVTRITYTPK